MGRPINVVICTDIDQDPSDTEPIVSGDTVSCGSQNPPPGATPGYCAFLQSQWVHHPGDWTLTALMTGLGTETIETFLSNRAT